MSSVTQTTVQEKKSRQIRDLESSLFQGIGTGTYNTTKPILRIPQSTSIFLIL
jgi:hypothetical protein